MTDNRWRQLMENDLESLTQQEISDGWHFCPDWDGLLIGPNMGETESCGCGIEFKKTNDPIIRDTDDSGCF